MTAFAGIVTFDGRPADVLSEERFGGTLGSGSSGSISVLRSDGALFIQQTPSRIGHPGPAPRTASAGRRIFVADARLDNRAELAAALALSPADLAHLSNSALVDLAYQRLGESGVARCLGAFAFACWDSQAHRLVLGRDCLGNRSLFFHRAEGLVVFATSLRTMLALPCVPRELDEMVLADFMAVNLAEPRRTFYRGIERVPSRTLVTFDRSTTHHGHYWSPDLHAPPPFRRDEDYVERARELFDQAVAATVADTPTVAVAASGGLDSSAIAATAARLGGAQEITCYTLVPPANFQIDVGPLRYLDERGKVESLLRMHPALDANFIAPEQIHRDMADQDRFFLRAGGPILGPTNLGIFSHLYDAVVAAGHKVLLEGSTGNFGLTWAGKFSLLTLLAGGSWRTFVRELAAVARSSGVHSGRILVREVLTRGAPAAWRRLAYRLCGSDVDSVSWYSALNPAFIAEHDLARRWRRGGFSPWFSESGWDAARHRARLMFDHNQFARDFRGMAREIYGFETRDPHSDRRLLEFTLQVPEPMFRRNGVHRSFGRAVFADRLPPEILNERRRGAQGAAWFRSLDARRQRIAADIEQLDASPTVRRLVDVPRLRNLVRDWPADIHAAEKRRREYRLMLTRSLHIGHFIRWAEGGNS